MGQVREEIVSRTEWARRIVDRYEAGAKVPQFSLQSAMGVLGLKPGTVIRRGRQPRFDPRVAAAGDE